MSRPRRVAFAALVAVVVAGCAESQDPGLVDERPGTVTTSHTLERCPPGGPDATTPPAGCLGADGGVLRP